MITASALTRHCAYEKVLKAKKPRSPKLEESAARGTAFHAAIEFYAKNGCLPQMDDLEIQGWVDLLLSQWSPPRGAMLEVPWGLSPTGEHVHVSEPEPHKYASLDGSPLLTAGRADVAWVEIPVLHPVLKVVDWKTGSWPVTPAAANLQVNAAARALALRAGVEWYMPGIYYARDGVFDWGDVVVIGSGDDSDMLADIIDAANLPPEPRPGPWCARCWERKACPSAQQ